MIYVASDLWERTPEIVAVTLHSHGFEPLARVAGKRHTTDVVVTLTVGRLAVIRCAAYATSGDHTALATMLSEGTFVWAGLVYDDRERSEQIGLIETFHISELDRLVSRFSELGEAFSEAR